MTPTLDRHADKWMPEPNSGCFLWLNGLNSTGYAFVWSGGRMRRVTRIVCEEVYGAPGPRMEASHLCDVPLCVNPLHLRWETPAQNNQRKSYDKLRAGARGRFGGGKGWEKNGDRYCARARFDGRRFYLGTYDTKEEAQRVYEDFCVRYLSDLSGEG
jgi:hypothetical protein